MSDYEIPVSGEINEPTVPLHGHLDVVVRNSNVVPNPQGEPTSDLNTLGIDNTIFKIIGSNLLGVEIPSLPQDNGNYFLNLEKTSGGYVLSWKRILYPSDSLTPSNGLYPS